MTQFYNPKHLRSYGRKVKKPELNWIIECFQGQSDNLVRIFLKFSKTSRKAMNYHPEIEHCLESAEPWVQPQGLKKII